MKLKVLNPDNTGLTFDMIRIREERMKSIARPDTEVSMVCQTKTKICVDSALDVAVTSLELIENALQAEKEGYDVIGLYCAGDPAIHAIREAVSIPVVGGGQASLQIAIGLGAKFSWITSAKNMVLADDFIRGSGVDYTRLASIRNVIIDIANARNMNQELIINKLEECGNKCIKDGAHVLVLGCLVFAGMGKILSKRLNIPVIDPAFSIISMAELYYYSGLCQSRLTYPMPDTQERSWQGGKIIISYSNSY